MSSKQGDNELWIISHYSGLPDEANPQKRQYYIGRYLSEKVKVRLFFSRYDYFTHSIRPDQEYLFVNPSLRLTLVHNSVSYQRNDWRRIVNALTYALRVLVIGLCIKEKPRYIYVAVPSNFAAISAWILSRVYKATLIYEVFDIWSMTFVHLHGKSRKSLIVRALLILDRFIVKRADLIVSPLDRFDLYCSRDLGLDIKGKYCFLPQGYEAKSASTTDEGNLIPEDITLWLHKARQYGEKIFIFAGTFSTSNNIKELVVAIKSILRRSPNVGFIFIGTGSLVEELTSLLEVYGEERVGIFPPVPFATLTSIYKKCDFALNSHPDIPLYEYGLASLKMVDHIRASLPVAYLNEYGLIDRLCIGFSSSNIEDFINKAILMIDDPAISEAYREGTVRAQKYFSWDSIIGDLVVRLNFK